MVAGGLQQTREGIVLARLQPSQPHERHPHERAHRARADQGRARRHRDMGPARRLRHPAVSQMRQQQRDGEDHHGLLRRDGILPRRGEQKDEERPVPQVQLVGPVGDRAHRPPLHRGPQRGAPLAAAGGQHRERAQQRPQGVDPGKGVRRIEHGARADHERHSAPPHHREPACGQPQACQRECRDRAQGELPQPRPRAEVRHRLIHGHQKDGIGERRHGHHRGQPQCGRTQRPSGPTAQERQRHDGHWPHDEELPLDRQRPEMLQGARLRTRRAIGQLVADQFPVLHIQRRGDDLPAHLQPPAQREHPGGQAQRGDQHHRRGRDEPHGRAGIVTPQHSPVAPLQPLHERPGDEVPRQQQEHVHPAGDPATAKEVEHHHERESHAAQSVEFVDPCLWRVVARRARRRHALPHSRYLTTGA